MMIRAADNLSAARPSVAKALEERDAGALTAICRRCQEAGAQWLDINPGFIPAARRAEVWRFAVETAEAACGLTLMLDAPDADTLSLGLSSCSRPPILNMATAQPERLKPVMEMAAMYGLEVVAATMTATVPKTVEERLGLASLIVEEAARQGVMGSRLILDPMVMPLALADGEAHAKAVIQFLRSASQVFDPAPRTLIALSNLATSTAGKQARFAAGPFLAAAWGAGLDIAMLDIFDDDLAQVAGLCRVFGGERVFAPGEYQD
jgi:5-methyltetrahydrofolate corrinoid/iron sulfur protein methyltransferase